MTVRKAAAALFAAALLICGCACGSSGAESGETIEVYRVVKTEFQTGGELLRAESIKKTGGRTDPELIISLLQQTPEDAELERSLPEDVSIISGTIDGTEMLLELSDGYLALSGIEKTLTDYCIALSLCGVSEIQTVSLYVRGELITPGLSSGDALLYDSEESPYEKQVRLYFAESDGRYLSVEQHTLSVSDDAMLERYIIDELLRGPNDELLRSAIPEGTRLVSVSTEDGVCTVCLSEEFWTNRPQTFAEARLAVYSIVNSLTSLAEVSEVVIQVEGIAFDTYVYMSLDTGMTRCGSIIGPVNSARGEMDVDIYMALPGLDRITPVPYIVARDEYLSVEACIIQAMTEAESGGGTASLLSQCGRPNLVSTRNGVCTIDVPKGYFDSCGENRTLAAEALTATVCAIDGISGVCMTEDGASLVMDGVDYSAVRTTNEEIILN